MESLNERLDKLKEYIQKPEFLEGKGLSNEVNIQIFCYKPEEEMAVRYFVAQLKGDNSLTCNIKECNLYQVFLEICEDKKIMKGIPKMEETKGSDFLRQRLAKIATVAAFAAKIDYPEHQAGDVLVLTGVGEVFPFMRVHALLEALQPVFSDIPILVMYPGVYDGKFVKLFDRLPANPYYRAFNVL